MSYRFQPGERVRTKYKINNARRHGVVESRDGAYVLVRLNYSGSILEAYDVELESLASSAREMARRLSR